MTAAEMIARNATVTCVRYRPGLYLKLGVVPRNVLCRLIYRRTISIRALLWIWQPPVA